MLKTIFLPWLVISEERESNQRYLRAIFNAEDRERRLKNEVEALRKGRVSDTGIIADLRAEVAALKADANGRVARGARGRFVSVKAS